MTEPLKTGWTISVSLSICTRKNCGSATMGNALWTADISIHVGKRRGCLSFCWAPSNWRYPHGIHGSIGHLRALADWW